jgi:hypothetical protein
VTLKDGQKLWGEGIGLTVPGFGTLVAAGPKPKINNTGGDAVSVPATAGNRQNVEVQGLDLQGSGNAVDVTATGANLVSVTISNNTVSGAGVEGIDLNAGSTGTFTATVGTNTITATGNGIDARTSAATTLTLDIANDTITAGAAGTGIFVDGSGGGTTTIVGFANNSVSGNTGGSGISITSATFDATAGGTFQTVSGGTTTIGASGNPVGANGIVLTTVKGDLSFTDLDIFANSGTAFKLTGTGAVNASANPGTGTRVTVGAGVAIFQATGGPAVDVTNATIDLQLSSLSSTNSPTTGVNLNTVLDGTSPAVPAIFSAGSGSTITGTSGTAFNVNASNASVTYNGTISGVTAGAGVSLTSNTNGTIDFTGTLTLSTGTNAAFTATGGGTVTASNTANTLTTTTGTALNVTSTTIGASGLKFKSINAGTAATGPATGIILNNTGASGSLTVSGNANASVGGDSSGGVIQHTSTYGISLTTTLSPSFTNMNIHDIARNGIDGTGVTNFTFANGTITNTGTAAAGQYEENSIAFVDKASPISDNTVDGTVSITGSSISQPHRNAIMIETWNGTISSLNISSNTISGGTTTSTIQDAVHVFSQGSAATTGNITTGTIQNNTISGFRFFDSASGKNIGGNGIRLVGGNTGANTFATTGTAANPIVISGNTISNMGSNGIATTFAGQQGTSHVEIRNNPISHVEGLGISVFFGGNGTFSGLVDGNSVNGTGETVLAGSAGIGVQSDNGTGTGDVTNSSFTISNNTISNTDGDGIGATGINNSGTMNVRVISNDVTTIPVLPARYGIRVQQSNTIPQPTLNLEIHGNTTAGGRPVFGTVPGNGIAVRQQDPVQFGIEGLTPSPTSDPTAYISSQNPSGHGTDKIAGTNFTNQNVPDTP